MIQRIECFWRGFGVAKLAALMAGGLAAVTGCAADAGNTGESVSNSSEALLITQTTWTQGVSPAQGVDTLMNTSVGFCYLSKIAGSFRGNGESVYLDTSTYSWVLHGTSSQSGVTATASCIPFSALKHGSDYFSSIYISNYGTDWIGWPSKASSGSFGGPNQFCFLTGFRGETNGMSEGLAVVPSANGWALNAYHQSGTGVQGQLACIARISGGIALADSVNFTPPPSDCSGASCNSVFTVSHPQNNFCVLNALYGRLRGSGESASVFPTLPGNLTSSFVTLHSQQNGIRGGTSCAYF